VVGGEVVERQLTGLDHLHHLGRDHRFGDAGDEELIVDPHVANAVRRTRRSAPGAVGGHHRGCHPAVAGHVVQDRPELRRHFLGDRLHADVGERLGGKRTRWLTRGGRRNGRHRRLDRNRDLGGRGRWRVGRSYRRVGRGRCRWGRLGRGPAGTRSRRDENREEPAQPT